MKRQSRPNGGAGQRLLGVLVLALLLPSASAAQEPETQRPREHVVRRGDTLWDLARIYLNDPFRWPSIFEANRSLVRNPHLIYPENRLIIPGILADATAVPMAEPPVSLVSAELERPPLFQRSAVDEPTVLSDAAAVSFAVQPGQFVSAAWLQDTTAIEKRGRVVRVVDPATEDETLHRTAFPRERVYMRYGSGVRPSLEDRLLIARVGRRVHGFGHILEPAAIVSVVALDAEVMTARVLQQFGPVEPENLVLDVPVFPLVGGMEAGAVEGGAEGRIIGFITEQSLPGFLDRGFVDIGSAQGLSVGDELLAYLPPREAPTRSRDVELPSEPVGRLRVIRVHERSATVMVTELRHPVLAPGVPVRVVRSLR